MNSAQAIQTLTVAADLVLAPPKAIWKTEWLVMLRMTMLNGVVCKRETLSTRLQTCWSCPSHGETIWAREFQLPCRRSQEGA